MTDFNEGEVCPTHNCEVARIPFLDGNSISNTFECPDCQLKPKDAENRLNKIFDFDYQNLAIEEAVLHEKYNNVESMKVLTERLERIIKYVQKAERKKIIKTINEL